MIHPNELRVGNYINTEKGMGQVASIYRYGSEEHRVGMIIPPLKKYEYKNEKREGVPLTIELFEKCGFVNSLPNDKVNGFYKHPTTGAHLEIGYITRDDVYEFQIHYFIKPIQFLHQFQNLYFALTGEELQINLFP